jgi:hypothetical protein
MTYLNTYAVGSFGTTGQTPFNISTSKNNLPVNQSSLAFGRETRKHPTSLQNAREQASMLLTIPVLLGVNGIAYIAGADEPQLLRISQNGKKINRIA